MTVAIRVAATNRTLNKIAPARMAGHLGGILQPGGMPYLALWSCSGEYFGWTIKAHGTRSQRELAG